MLRTLIGLTCLALAGCVESPVPLESGDKVFEPRLIGIWKSDLDGDPMVATIRQDGNGALVADVKAYWEPGPRAATKHYAIVLAQFGEQHYASIRDTELAPSYFIARFEFEGNDRVCLQAAYSNSLVEDLELKRLSGNLKPDRHVPSVWLSASPDELRGYFASRGARAFDEQPLMALQRVSSDELPPPRTRQERDRDPPGFNEVRACKP